MTKDQGLRTKGFVDVERLCANSSVRHAEFFDSLGSTNDRATLLAGRTDLPMPALVVARLQSAGRGRGTNTWWAGEGALTFSLVLNTLQQGIMPHDWPRLSLTTAVAVCDALKDELSATPQSAIRNPQSRLAIKWPNDVLVDGRKIAGILIESPGGPAPAKDRLIVGMGINVNNSWQSAPRDAGREGTAICDVTGRKYELQLILLAVLHSLEQRFGQLADGNPQLPQAWQCLDSLVGKVVKIENSCQQIEGKAAGLATDGSLLIQNSSGQVRVYSGSARQRSEEKTA